MNSVPKRPPLKPTSAWFRPARRAAMKSPHFVPAEAPEEQAEKAERELRKILRESDKRANELFERHDSSRPELPEPPRTARREKQ
jgi:hypothetical protein